MTVRRLTNPGAPHEHEQIVIARAGGTIAAAATLERVLDELRERVRLELAAGHRVRLV